MSKLNRIKVWDPAVRLFHWSLVVAFTVAYFTEEDILDVHVVAGYTVLGLVLFHILWGFIGPQHARFSDFVYRPGVVGAYLKDLVLGRARRYLGHNPAGGVMIILLFISLLGVTVSGLAVYAADEQAGPLAFWLGGVGERWEDRLEEVHEFLANLTLGLVFLHILGVLAESFLHRENLVASMFTGYKKVDDTSRNKLGGSAQGMLVTRQP
jgi:cytochrome b